MNHKANKDDGAKGNGCSSIRGTILNHHRPLDCENGCEDEDGGYVANQREAQLNKEVEGYRLKVYIPNSYGNINIESFLDWL